MRAASSPGARREATPEGCSTSPQQPCVVGAGAPEASPVSALDFAVPPAGALQGVQSAERQQSKGQRQQRWSEQRQLQSAAAAAAVAAARQDFGAAARGWQRLLARRPEHPLFLARAAEAQAELGNKALATDLYGCACAADPHALEPLRVEATSWYALPPMRSLVCSRPVLALSCASELERALALQPCLPTYRAAVRAQLAAGSPRRGLALARAAAAAFPASAAARVLCAEVLAAAPGQQQAAMEMYERALRMGAPPNAALGLAGLLESSGQWEHARSVLHCALNTAGLASPAADALHARLAALYIKVRPGGGGLMSICTGLWVTAAPH